MATTVAKGHSRLLRVMAVLRVVGALLSFELLGSAALVPELVACDESSEICCTDCPIENDGTECPPGCPSCHCSHNGGIGLPPAFHKTTAHPALVYDDVEQVPYEATVPRAPPMRGLYRPPRLLASPS